MLLWSSMVVALLLGAPAQEAPLAAAVQDETPALPRLGPGEVARIAPDLVLRDIDLDRYLGQSYARRPTGEQALQQLLSEALILQAAGHAGITADETDIEAALLALDAQARAATDGKQGVAESLSESVGQDDLRAAVHLLVLHERIVRKELGLAPEVPLDPRELKTWLSAAVRDAALTVASLEDVQAATWSGGAISKAAVGNRLRRMISPEDLSGVLTEMIGVLLVRRESGRRGINLTPADATEEILHRNAALRSTPGAAQVSYDQYLEAIEKRSLEEVLRSDKFATEVLLRKIAEQDWTEQAARELWEQNRQADQTAGVTDVWEDARSNVWGVLRQRSYTAIFQESRIARRF
jgi:hypothetical protein